MPHGLGLQPSTPSIASGSTRVASGPPTSLLPVGGLRGREARQTTEALVAPPPLQGFGPTPTGAPTIERKTEAVAQRRQERGGRPSFEDEPLAALGLLLQDVGAALRGQELPSAKLAAGAREERRIDLEEQGLRLRGAAAAMKALELGMDMLDDTPIDQQAEVLSGIARTVSIPGFDIEGVLRAHVAGEIEGFKARLKAARADPFLGAFLASVPGLESASPKVLNEALKTATEAKQSIIADLAKQEVLLPGEVKKAKQIAKVKEEVKPFKRREVNLLDKEAEDVTTFVVDDKAAETQLNAMLSSKQFVRVGLDARPTFQIVTEPVTNRKVRINLFTGKTEDLEALLKRTGVTGAEPPAAPGVPAPTAAEPSEVKRTLGGKRLSEVLLGSAFMRQVKRLTGITIGQVTEMMGSEVLSFPEVATADTAFGLFRNRLFSALRVKGQRLKVEAEILLSLVPNTYDVFQSRVAANRTLKELALRLNELRVEADTLSNNLEAPVEAREEARILAERLPSLIDDLFLTVATSDELQAMPKGTTAFVLSEGDFFTRD